MAYPNSLGGPATRIYGYLTVIPGETLTIQVGGQGFPAGNTRLVGSYSAGGWPDGGDGGSFSYIDDGDPVTLYGAGGGGSTRIWRAGVGGTLLALCGGGGGLGYYDSFIYNDLARPSVLPNGQSGIPTPGQHGRTTPAHTSPIVLHAPGQGGTSLVGGAGGNVFAQDGDYLYGGNGSDGTSTTILPSGGGGGGLYGGGGGGRQSILNPLTGCGNQGGGGSSFTLTGSWTGMSLSNTNNTHSGEVQFFWRIEERSGWSLGIQKLLLP